jgi:isochorismate synthase EntC
VCGLPSAPAEAWLTTHEPVSRGWYAAPVGWFDAAGEGAFAVAIRSALVHAHEAWLYAGAGVVEGSVPSHEYAETAVKQRAMLTALGVES